MQLYRKINHISVAPGKDPTHAVQNYSMHEDNATEEDFEVIIPHDDFVKIFRFARTLESLENCSNQMIEDLVRAYVKQLGYDLTNQEIEDGILSWVERFYDIDDEDIEDWVK